MDGSLIVKVECYSGSEYANRPMTIVHDQARLPVARILTENYTPEGKHFRIALEDGRVLELNYLEVEDLWEATGLA